MMDKIFTHNQEDKIRFFFKKKNRGVAALVSIPDFELKVTYILHCSSTPKCHMTSKFVEDVACLYDYMSSKFR